MKGILGILMVIVIAHPLGRQMSAQGMPASDPLTTDIEAIAAKLDTFAPFAASVEYEATLPMTSDPVTYTISLASDEATERPDLFPSNYLIEWELPLPDGDASRGFTAYFGGHLYRFANNRLTEYHWEWDSIPFISPRGGVQEVGQFIDLLPASLARQLRRFAAGSDYSLRPVKRSKFGGTDALTVSGVEEVRGQTAREFSLVFDAATGAPLRIHYEMNPGQISETTLTATYTYPSRLEAVADEQALIALYPEQFERYRQSNFRIENMRGEPLPGFSLPTLTGERYSRAPGDPLTSPTVVAILDPEVDANPTVISTLRRAAAQAPRSVSIIWAFTGNHIDTIEPLIHSGEDALEGETAVISARPLARDCGTNVFPTILVVEPSGKIANVILGFNNSLASDVIQSVAIMR